MTKDSSRVLGSTEGEEPLVGTTEDGGLSTDGRGGYLEGQGGGTGSTTEDGTGTSG